jgi:hypothetical protein
MYGNVASDWRHRNAMKNDLFKKKTAWKRTAKKVGRSVAPMQHNLDKSNVKRHWKKSTSSAITALGMQNPRDEPCKQLYIGRRYNSRGHWKKLNQKRNWRRTEEEACRTNYSIIWQKNAENIRMCWVLKLWSQQRQFLKGTGGSVKECCGNNDTKKTWEINETGDEIMVGANYWEKAAS